MSETPDDLRYAKTHEWARREEDGTMTVGITDHAQEMLGDLVYVELPETGRTVSAEEEIGVVESVKAASDIYSPISGEVTEVNEALTDSPELINGDPYGEGWLMRIKPDDEREWESLLDAEAYQELADSEEQ
jgi:glycine cleavage system H protein